MHRSTIVTTLWHTLITAGAFAGIYGTLWIVQTILLALGAPVVTA
ncbi:MAG: hypothetical protein WBA05_17985 [Gordonia sp. (in: high G+C Gram-positive bacteria)]